MNVKLNRLMNDERGITALETAIILIAFVVVAADLTSTQDRGSAERRAISFRCNPMAGAGWRKSTVIGQIRVVR